MTALSRPSPPFTTTPAPYGGVRISFRQPVTEAGFVDAGWRRRSRALTVELPPLLDVLWTACRDVTRVSYNVASGEPAPRRLQVEGRLVRLGGFRGQDPLLLTVFDRSGREHLDVLVIPAGDRRRLRATGPRPGRRCRRYRAAGPDPRARRRAISNTRPADILDRHRRGRLGDRRRTYTDRFRMTGPAGGHPLSRIAGLGSTPRCGQRP
jgi:hypothetical protein